MSGLTADVEAQVINSIILAGGSVYLALHTSDPGNDPDGSTEVSVASYSRIEVTEADWNVTGGGPTELSNASELRFGTFEQDVGDITHASLAGSVDGTDFLATGDFAPVKNFQTGDFVLYEAGECTLTVD